MKGYQKYYSYYLDEEPTADTPKASKTFLPPAIPVQKQVTSGHTILFPTGTLPNIFTLPSQALAPTNLLSTHEIKGPGYI